MRVVLWSLVGFLALAVLLLGTVLWGRTRVARPARERMDWTAMANLPVWKWIGRLASFAAVAGLSFYLFQPDIFVRLFNFLWGWRTGLLGLVLLGLGSGGGIVGRLLSGLGLAALVGTAFGLLLFPLFREEARPSAAAAGIATAIGPAVTPYGSLIQEAAQRHGVPADLIKAVIQRESNFNPNAKSDQGAIGLMQVLPSTAKEYGITDLFDPEQNIEAGTGYLAEMLMRYGGNTELALAAYNSGPDTVDRWAALRGPIFSNIAGDLPVETRAYVPEVLGFQRQYASGAIGGAGREIARIPLLGEGRVSQITLAHNTVPARWLVYFEGPAEARVHFDDGTSGPITDWYGVKAGNKKFSGPAGEEVVVRAYPPQ